MPLRHGDPRNSFVYSLNLSLLLAALVLVLVIVPVFETMEFGGLLLYGVLTLALLAAGGLASQQRREYFLSLTLPLLAVPALWLSAAIDQPVLFVLSCVGNATFCLLLAGLLLTRVMRQYVADWQSITGTVVAYLLLGLAWALLYWSTERIGSERVTFSQSQRMASPLTGSDIAAFSEMVYFSFVTMSTLGYGDITPQTPLARTLAWMQAVTGQFYIAVLVARLVAEIRLARSSANAE